MAKTIEMDFTELKRLSNNWHKKSPRAFQFIASNTLNDQAFASQKHAKGATIPQLLKPRNKFLQSSVRVQKSTTRTMQAFYGAIAISSRRSSPFMGLRAQQFGDSAFADKAGVPTLAGSRGGQRNRKVKPGTRWNRIRGQMEIINGQSDNWKLYKLSRQKYQGPIFIKKHKKMKKGIYVMKGRQRKLRNGTKVRPLVMTKDLSQGRMRGSRIPWMTSNNRIITKQLTRRFFIKQAIRELNFKK